jgi:FG-GAP repeat
MKLRFFFLPLLGICIAALIIDSKATELWASDGAVNDLFGSSVSLSGGVGLVGSPFDDSGSIANQGSAYVFRNLNSTNGPILQSVKLVSSDGAASDFFGIATSLSGTMGLIGASGDTIGTHSYRGSAYLFRNLGSAAGQITQSVKLISSDGASSDSFGTSVSLSEKMGLIGAYAHDTNGNEARGAAYLFRNLDTAAGTVTQNAKLIASDGAALDLFGTGISMSGNIGLVGAQYANMGGTEDQGCAYVFRNLNTATGTITQSAKLIASDGAFNDQLGAATSINGNTGLVQAYGDNIGGNLFQGSVYLYRNLDVATGTITQSAKLTTTNGTRYDYLGSQLAQSGNKALVASFGSGVGTNNKQGSVYLFQNLDSASGNVTETLEIRATNGTLNDLFGQSVSLDGDLFAIGAPRAKGVSAGVGSVYVGSIESLTTMDAGNATQTIQGVSFRTNNNWIIGESTDNNFVTLSAGDTASITVAPSAMYIGRFAGSDFNTVNIAGNLVANYVYIGAMSGNVGNTLRLENTSTIDAVALIMGQGNNLVIRGNYTAIPNLLGYLDDTALKVWIGNGLQTVTAANYASLIQSQYSAGLTTITAIPEMKAPVLLAMIGLATSIIRRRPLR